MTVLMRENDRLDAAGSALQRRRQTLRNVVKNAVAFGQPATVEQLVSVHLESLFANVEMLLIGRLVSALCDLATLVEIAAKVVHQLQSKSPCQVVLGGLRMQLAEADRPWWRDDPKRPRG